MDFIKKILACPFTILAFALVMATAALISALTAQFAFDLQPCILCVYQRIPFVAVVIFALLGLTIKPLARSMILLCMVAFFINSGIAFYHHGVEQLWWASIFEGCRIPADLEAMARASTTSMLNQLLKTPSVPCNKIPWVDPVMGQSMAFWNIPFCFGMAIVCLAHIFMKHTINRPHKSSRSGLL